MKLKKINVNILVSLESNNELNEIISTNDINNDIGGFHIVIKNSVSNNFFCELVIESEDEIFWSIDKKKTKNKCINIEYLIQKCKIKVESGKEINLFLWGENKKEIKLKSVKNILIKDLSEGLDTLLLTDTNDENFEKIFGFNKKYHFDQYRMFLIINLCNSGEENSNYAKDMTVKIISHAKQERIIEKNCINEHEKGKFYTKVFKNLLEENCGQYDEFRDYREKIINKLKVNITNLSELLIREKMVTGETKIITNRVNKVNEAVKTNDLRIVKKLDLKEDKPEIKIIKNTVDSNPFERKQITKTFNYQTINEDIFVIIEFNRKGTYFDAINTIMLYKYKDIRLVDIEQTIEKIVINSVMENYEILLYFDGINLMSSFEKMLENIFFNYDNLFRVKIITPKNKLGQISKNLSEIQKLIILSHFHSSVNPYLFLVSVGSIIPKRYITYLNIETKKYNDDENNIFVLSKANMLNKINGKIEYYETNTNKLFNFFIECMFPVISKKLFSKINYKAPFLYTMDRFKDFKNFLVKNGTTTDVKIFTGLPDNYSKESLHIYES